MFSNWLKAFLAVCLLGCTACSPSASQESEPVSPSETAAEQKEDVVGMWFSYLEYQSLCAGMDEEAFTAFCEEAVANMRSIGVNNLYLHTVAFTDAFYPSSIYPRTSVLGDIEYDPYQIFSAAAVRSGIKVHAWINPMRSVTVEEAASLPEDFIIRQWIDSNDERVRRNGDRYYLNPAYPEVRALILSVVQELLEKYHPEGIHMDDYFYPYNTEKNFDAYIFSRAQDLNSELTLEEFRTAHVDGLVKEIHDAVKAYDPNIEFGISPAGNIDNCINLLFANPYHWVEQGSVDYLIPQIYWGYLHPIKPFEPTLQEWKGVVGDSNVDLLVGLAAYVIGSAQSLSDSEEVNNEWVDNDNMMARQMETSFQEGCRGVVLFSYSSLFAPDEDTREIVENEIVHIKNYLNP